MAERFTTTIRLTGDDAAALARARAAGHETSELVRQGLRVVAAKYYRGKRPPTTGLFVSTDVKLGDEASLFADLETPTRKKSRKRKR